MRKAARNIFMGNDQAGTKRPPADFLVPSEGVLYGTSLKRLCTGSQSGSCGVAWETYSAYVSPNQFRKWAGKSVFNLLSPEICEEIPLK